jgi:serine/threonine protein kinase
MESRKTRRVKRVNFDVGLLKDDPNFSNHFITPRDGATKVSLMQIRMLHGGQRMNEYILDIERLIENWIHIQIHLAEGLRIFHNRGIAYGNFTFDNILINDENTPLMIYSVEEFISENTAPELDYKFSKEKGHLAMKTIYSKKQILHEIEEVFPSRESVLSELIKFSDKYDDTYVYGAASDMWSFGYHFYKLYMMLLSMPCFMGSEFYTKYHGIQMQIFRGLLRPDPYCRLSIDDLLMELYSLRMN